MNAIFVLDPATNVIVQGPNESNTWVPIGMCEIGMRIGLWSNNTAGVWVTIARMSMVGPVMHVWLNIEDTRIFTGPAQVITQANLPMAVQSELAPKRRTLWERLTEELGEGGNGA